MDEKSYPQKGNINIGNNVWIGYNATIMAGVTIGDGVIIGTNATVINDIEKITKNIQCLTDNNFEKLSDLKTKT